MITPYDCGILLPSLERRGQFRCFHCLGGFSTVWLLRSKCRVVSDRLEEGVTSHPLRHCVAPPPNDGNRVMPTGPWPVIWGRKGRDRTRIGEGIAGARPPAPNVCQRQGQGGVLSELREARSRSARCGNRQKNTGLHDGQELDFSSPFSTPWSTGPL